MTRFELATLTLARLCATTAPHPLLLPFGCFATLLELRENTKPTRKTNTSIVGYFCTGCLPPIRLVALCSDMFFEQPTMSGRLAQLVARFPHTEEVIGSSPVSPTTRNERALKNVILGKMGPRFHAWALTTWEFLRRGRLHSQQFGPAMFREAER
jgi:hypothetical protein